MMSIGTGPSFACYVGGDYSGAQTPTASLKSLHVYLADRKTLPVEVPPPPGRRKYWSRRGLSEWLVERLTEAVPTIVGVEASRVKIARLISRMPMQPPPGCTMPTAMAVWPDS